LSAPFASASFAGASFAGASFASGPGALLRLHHELDIFVGLLLLAGALFAYWIASRRVQLSEDVHKRLLFFLCGILFVGALDQVAGLLSAQASDDPFSVEEWCVAAGLVVGFCVLLPWLSIRVYSFKKALKHLADRVEFSAKSEDLAKVERERISQRYAESADALRRSVERAYRLAALVENARDAVVGVDDDGKIWQWNAAADALFGLDALAMVGESLESIEVSPSGNLWREVVRLSRPPFLKGVDELTLVRGDGTTLPIWVSVSKFPPSAGGASGFAIVARDLSEKKRVEERISAALAEKSLLLKEVHHRVKNNLQLICSLLRLQSKEASDPEALKLFRKSEDRIRSLALVHERLYRSENLAMLNFGGYVRDLVGQLVRSAELGGKTVEAEFAVEEIPFPVDNAITCGLIVNELVGNSLKHGASPAAKLRIGLTRDTTGVVFTVWDNGKVVVDPDLFDNATSLGLKLVRSLTQQLGGTVGVHQNGGTEFKVVLPASVLTEKDVPHLRASQAA
jgi:PAS domain S-box-containing protein